METLNKRNYGLDVVRTIAVSFVVIIHSIHHVFHLSLPYFWYFAFGGVELFFSLSGFLIGRILIELFRTPNLSLFNISKFWARRWLRTLPLYYILYFIYLAAYSLFISQQKFNWEFLVFLQNIKAKPNEIYGESWSLSIEEWFYLLVPLFIFIFHFLAKNVLPILKNDDRPFLIVASILIIGMNLFRMLVFKNGTLDDQAVLYRFDAVAYGLIAAYISKRIGALEKMKAFLYLYIGIMLWLIAAVIYMKFGQSGMRLLYYPLCGTGTSFIVLGMFYYSFKKKCRLVTFTSKISYSIYLVHLTGILIPLGGIIPEYGFSFSVCSIMLIILLIYIASSLTYHFIELPFLSLRQKYFYEGKI